MSKTAQYIVLNVLRSCFLNRWFCKFEYMYFLYYRPLSQHWQNQQVSKCRLEKVVKWNTLCQCDWAIIFLLIFKIFLLLFCCILNVSIALVSLQPFIILFSKNWQLSKATQSRLKFSAQNISESLKGWKEENCGPVRALRPFKEQYRVDFLFAVAQSSSEWEKILPR